ncbi:MAG: hypothetical protein A3F11_01470, partial [Gammaproteobacteria bacterium RIFCSPHIGHO2_12_FULL_37_14]
NLEELLAQVRFNLVDKIASIAATGNAQGVHVHNRFFEVAQSCGYGVWRINGKDAYLHTGSSNLSDEDIEKKLEEGFAKSFHLFGILNLMREQIEVLIADRGYDGRKEEGYDPELYPHFTNLELFQSLSIKEAALRVIDEKTYQVLDIHWQIIKNTLLLKLSEEGFVDLSPEEATLLAGLSFSFDSKTLTTLIPHGDELAQCLMFFSEWTIAQKVALVNAYLKDKSTNEQKDILAILNNEAPQLTTQLKTQPQLQSIYFDIAIQEKEVAVVRAHIEQGADINAALSLLFSEAHKSDTLTWLHENKSLLAHITQDGMKVLIPNGKYQDKPVVEALVSTKKGRQLLLENPALQTLLPETIAHRSLADYLTQAAAERQGVNVLEGFFKKVDPLVTQFGQYIAYGDMATAEELLKANPLLLEKLLTEKITVTDYSRRKLKKKTGFQIALCAMDDEMCEMLAKYMSKDEVAHQYQELFPEGQDKHFEAQTPFDFSAIVDAITSSNDADVEKALDLELPNDTALWNKLEQFRADFTERSYQETVFNPQHLLKAYELYEKQFEDWNWNQRDLFWRQVIGYTQRFLPANIAMDFAQGLYYRVEQKEKSNHSLKFRFGEGAIFPLSFNFHSGLGYQYAVDAIGEGVRGVWRRRARRSFFKTHVEQKLQICKTYAALSKNENLRDGVK